ncbi:hypothetical protein LCGC14_1589970 [marine sediment metagenome]|uniref:Uncharacterized protein n=1 Tax=marine sediment metagenome TaxID=412755 RepID=A0A0F9J0I4_9ZZZZ
MKTQEQKIKSFAKLLEQARIEELHKDNVACEDNILNAKVTTKQGKKYIKVDVGHSGAYMVEISTERIFGIKAYGVIHRGHCYGTLDEINQWYWGGYTARKRAKQIEPTDKEEYRLVLTVRQVVNGEQNLVCYDGLCGIYDTLKEAVEAAKCLKRQLA